MSQFPPPGPQQQPPYPPQQQPYPPQAPYPPQQQMPPGYGQPPMVPPPYGQGYPGGMPGPRKSNGAAIASLILGILGCVPFITGILAVILGVVGIKAANDPQRGGKGMAIAGLLLGLLSLGVWGLFGGGIYKLVQGTKAEREVTRQFVADLSAGNVDAAKDKTDGTITAEELGALSTTMKGWGAVTDTTIFGVGVEPGKTQVTGIIKFGQTPKSFQAHVVNGPDGKPRISSFEFMK